jgi:hypothetical protein
MLKHTVNKVSSLRDFLIAIPCRMLKHTVNKVSSLRDLGRMVLFLPRSPSFRSEDVKFQRIFRPGGSGNRNSKEFFVFSSRRHGIPKNFSSRRFREQKFFGIFHIRHSGNKTFTGVFYRLDKFGYVVVFTLNKTFTGVFYPGDSGNKTPAKNFV